MPNNKLILRSVISPWVSPFNDITTGSVLSWADVDNNFIYLKGESIHSGYTLNNQLILQKINGNNINIDLEQFSDEGNRWFIPYGEVFEVPSDYQSFIYGDLYVNGLLKLNDNSQLVVLNGDIILSGGSISGNGSTLLVNLPEFDTVVTGATFNTVTGVATFTNNSGGTFSLSGLSSSDVFVTGGTYNPSNGVATFSNNSGGTFNVSGFLTGYTNFYTTGATLIGPIAYFDRTDSLSAYTLDLSGIDFTGNTSASCISDLYISNLHGCSPITIHDNMQQITSNASGLLSTAYGGNTLASGNYSHAEGYGTTAGGYASHAEGSGTITTNSYSHAEGLNTTATGQYSHSEGVSTTSNGFGSHSEGNTTISNGLSSHAEGHYTTANGDYGSHSEGYQTIATAESAHAEGGNTTASGVRSHAEGNNTTASGYASHAEGNSTKSLGLYSHSEGYLTNASGDYSHAGGADSVASGLASFIHSSGSTVTGDRSVVLGGSSLSGVDDDTVYVPNFNSRGVSLFSGSGSGVVTIIGSGSTTPILSVQGSSGELFSVTDSLIGSLFSVNDISGLPVLEAFSDNTILMGSYQAPSLNTTIKKTLSSGTNNIYSIPTSAYTGAFFDYTLLSSTGARAGNIMSIWSGSSTQYTDVSTNDIGSTSGVTFSVVISGSSAVLQGTASTSGWTLKTIVRSI